MTVPMSIFYMFGKIELKLQKSWWNQQSNSRFILLNFN